MSKLLLACIGALLLGACATGPASSSKEIDPQAEFLAAFDGLEPEEIIRAGDLAAAQGESERALFIYNQAVLLEPSADTWYRIGQVYVVMGQKTQAWQAYARALQEDAEYAPAHEEMGLLHLSMKQAAPAAKHLQKAVEFDTTRWRAHNALGVLADVDKNYVLAIDHYNAALDANPGSAMLLNNLGYSYYLSGNYEQAEVHLRMAVGLDPDYMPAVANLGLSYARRGEYDEAVEILRTAMEKRQAYNDVGFIAYHNGDLDDAAWLLTEAIRISPNYYETARKNLRQVRKAIVNGKRDPSESDNTLMADENPAKPGTVAYRTVDTAALNVRTAASPQAPIAAQLARGVEVEVMYELGEWAFVEFWRSSDNGRQAGWVMAGYLSAVVPDAATAGQARVSQEPGIAVSAP
jgi:Flp pilus assembly protein TadD